MRLFVRKVVFKIRGIVVSKLRYQKIYPFLYRSYWHYLFTKRQIMSNASENYYTARPNFGAGIGHQMANWIAGYWFAKAFEVQYAYSPFPEKRWNYFLGFYLGEDNVDSLKRKGYVLRRLPMFDEDDEREIQLQRNIISSYSNKKIIFLAEQDQFYERQYDVMLELQQKFYSAEARLKDQLFYSSDHFNIAVHVRRGDILSDSSNPNLKMRYLANDYYLNALKYSLGFLDESIVGSKEIHIFLFSQGLPEDFAEFSSFDHLHYCLGMDVCQSFLHLVMSDLLITSKSSFSYKPALLNRGIKVCPANFWHSYPNLSDWILLDDYGKPLTRSVEMKGN